MRSPGQLDSLHATFATLFLCAAAALCAGCAGNDKEPAGDAQVTDRWQAPPDATQGKPARSYRTVFVVGISHSEDLRRQFEDEFVRQLESQGVKGIASHTVMQPRVPTPGEVVQAVRASDADGVIVTRLLKREQWRRATLGAVDYQTHYRDASQSVYVPQSSGVYRSEVVTLETRLFDAGREQMVWAGTTELFDPRATPTQVARLVRAIVNDLKAGTFI